MRRFALAFLLILTPLCFAQNDVLKIKFMHGLQGREVTLKVDGRTEQMFAGKLEFTDGAHVWSTVCANVRANMSGGQVFEAEMINPYQVGGNLALAARIVERSFNEAQSPAQCAGLQLAVWNALEYGSHAIGSTSTLSFQADQETREYARSYYLDALMNGGAKAAAQCGAGTLGQTGGQTPSQISSAGGGGSEGNPSNVGRTPTYMNALVGQSQLMP